MYLKDLMDKREKQRSFHMPGHKEKYNFFQKNIESYDLTEYDNFDNLANPKTVIKNSINRIERLFGSEKSFILVNGATVGILSSIFYLESIGGEILAYRHSHKSFFNGIKLTGQKTSYFYPLINKDGFVYDLDYEQIDKKLVENQNIKSIFIVSPTYEGVVFDIEKLYSICQKRKVILIVDQAHGAHFPFSDYFPKSAIKYSDIVITSLHKTLPALTQTAILHCKEQHKEAIDKFINIFQTTSPSYIFMYSIDKLMEDIENNKLDFNSYFINIDNFREKVKKLKNIGLLNLENIDKTRITLYSNYMTGSEINDFLKSKNIFSEMYINNYIVFISTVLDTKEDLDILLENLILLDKEIELNNKIVDKKLKSNYNYTRTLKNESIYTLKETENFQAEYKYYYECENLISKDYIIPYPPGIPILLPGEVITKDIIDIIDFLMKEKIELIGIKNKNIKICRGVDFYFK